MESHEEKPLLGGEFLVRKTKPESIFIPEEWTEEQLMICLGYDKVWDCGNWKFIKKYIY